MAQQIVTLFRSEIQRQADRPTKSTILRYVGRRLQFDRRVYGYPDGTFFALNHESVSYPAELEDLSLELQVNLDAMPDIPRLRQAMVDAQVAEAWVEAPELLAQLAQPDVRWLEADVRDLQRKHTIAAARVVEVSRLVEKSMRLRVWKPEMRLSMAEPPGKLPEEFYDLTEGLDPLPHGALAAPLESEELSSESDVEATAVAPSSSAVVRAQMSIIEARNDELPQRLPGGARRRLNKLPAGQYIAFDDELEPRKDLCAAMTDAQAKGRATHESTVIDWDGEWPVVVRRYADKGRIVYKIEDALRRASRGEDSHV